MALTSEAKRLLAETIRGTAQDPSRGLRHRLLEAIKSEAAGRYRLAVPLKEAKLDEAHHRRRERLEAYLDEKTRATKPKNAAEAKKARERILREAEREAAATLLNRIITLRLLEAHGLSRSPIVTGGWNSKGYREFRDFAHSLVDDDAEGYAVLLQLVFDELATDLPGLFGDVGLTRLLPVPPKALRDVVETLDNPELASAWTDDVTLGWVYQYWIDFERDALDLKVINGGKIAPHEIASKTQMFTDRYIVEWLLQNSLGLIWLCICKRQGWTADAERILPALDTRRANWRAQREVRAIEQDALMPIDGELEERWKYFVPQPLPSDAIDSAPEGVGSIKILDPACGSGHFLVIAFDLLAALYREEARHRGNSITDTEIAKSILEKNLFGIDIDPRAIQIAAASLYLKAKTFSRDARPRSLNLVAPALQLGQLPTSDPSIVQLRQDLKQEVGIPEELTTRMLSSLAGVDYLGSLLKVDAAVDEALRSVELELERGQGDFFLGLSAPQVRHSLDTARATVLDRLEQFLSRHSSSEDLGLRLDGEQFAAGVRFTRMMRDGTYDVVVGNPPYQWLSKAQSFEYVTTTYPAAKADLYAAFLQRGLELTRPGGLSAMVAMRGWLFQGQFAELRKKLLHNYALCTLGDLDKGAFESMPTSQMISVATSVFCVSSRPGSIAVALQPTAPGEKFWGADRTQLKRAAILAQRGRHEFDPQGFEVIKGEPLVYWWSNEFLKRYGETPKLGERFPGVVGLRTSDNARFLRAAWECRNSTLCLRHFDQPVVDSVGASPRFVPYLKGARGRSWFENVADVARWDSEGLEYRVTFEHKYKGFTSIQNRSWYFRPGLAFAMIGNNFSARAHRMQSIVGHKAASLFPSDVPHILCLMNSTQARTILQSLNPGIGFEVGDVNRLPVFPVPGADQIFSRVEAAFSEHEAARECSVEFKHVGPSAWGYAQDWAQRAVDRAEGAPLPPYHAVFDPPAPESFISFAVGVTLGRFDKDGKGVLDIAPDAAVASGILFISGEGNDSLDAVACVPVQEAWKEYGAAIGRGSDLRTYLRLSFFAHHKKLYENRPIYFPLTSVRKTFVAFISIHRWTDDTLSVLLADHLMPSKKRLEGELDDLRTAKVSEAKRANRAAVEKRFAEVQKLIEELSTFINEITEVADHGPPPSDDKTKKREADARFVMDLDDGAMVNSSALWPLLDPSWKEPRKWWKQLANAEGKKDYDWSHLAGRYFPARVRNKCHDDPSLAVAHGCFWELHPAKAYAWELRLQDEIKREFTIDETNSDASRKKFLAEHAGEAKEILATEVRRRERRVVKADDQAELFDEATDEEAEEESDE